MHDGNLALFFRPLAHARFGAALSQLDPPAALQGAPRGDLLQSQNNTQPSTLPSMLAHNQCAPTLSAHSDTYCTHIPTLIAHE
eukprot:365531-Chlamydomonas_euryale.AAC.13